MSEMGPALLRGKKFCSSQPSTKENAITPLRTEKSLTYKRNVNKNLKNLKETCIIRPYL
jgi:hypothetical protein